MRDDTIRVRVTAEQAAQIDAQRIGEETRSQTVRRLLFAAAPTLAVEPISATPAPTMAQTVPSAVRVANPRRTQAVPVVEKTTEVLAEVLAEVVVEQVPEHRHRRGEVLDTTWVKGVQVKTYGCATQGCPAILGGP